MHYKILFFTVVFALILAITSPEIVFGYADDDVEILVSVDKSSYKVGDLLNIKGTGAHSYTVFANIISPNGDQIVELMFIAAKSGDFATVWIIPHGLDDGTYIIQIKDVKKQAQTTFDIGNITKLQNSSQNQHLIALKSVKKISSELSDFAVVEFRVINYLNEDLDFSKKGIVHLKNSNGKFFESTVTNQLKDKFGIECSDSGNLVTSGLTKEISLCFEVPIGDQEDYLLVIDKDKTILGNPHEIHLYLNSHNLTTEFSNFDINSVFFTIHDVKTKSITGYNLLIIELTVYNGYAPLNKFGEVTRTTVPLEAKKFFVTDLEDNNYSRLSTQYSNTGYDEYCPRTEDLTGNKFDDFVYCFDIPKSTQKDTEYWLVLNDARTRYQCGIDCQEKMWSLSSFMSSSITEDQKILDSFEIEQDSSIPAESSKSKTNIPGWVKQVAEFWISDQIDDSGFVQVIEYLVKQEIISIPYAEAPEGESAVEIPVWIKTNAEFWINGDVSDDDFALGLEWLINNGIIRV